MIYDSLNFRAKISLLSVKYVMIYESHFIDVIS